MCYLCYVCTNIGLIRRPRNKYHGWCFLTACRKEATSCFPLPLTGPFRSESAALIRPPPPRRRPLLLYMYIYIYIERERFLCSSLGRAVKQTSNPEVHDRCARPFRRVAFKRRLVTNNDIVYNDNKLYTAYMYSSCHNETFNIIKP